MKALVLAGINVPLRLETVPEPTLGDGQVKIRIKAAGLNRRDYWIYKGQYAGLKYPIVLGSDGCGLLESEANGLKSGAEVVINPSMNWGENAAYQGPDFKILGMPDQGCMAETIAIDMEQVFAKPPHLSMVEAAALPLAGLTAYRAIFTKGQLKAGQKVLITGIGGGVASLALQFCLAMNADVWVTSSSIEKLEKSVSLGAKGGELYTNTDYHKALKLLSGGFDLIIDSAGGPTFGFLAEMAAPGGRIVSYGGTSGPISGLVPQRLYWKQLTLSGTTMGTAEEFAQMLEFVKANKIVPMVETTLPMAEGQQAFDIMETSSQFGKIVLTW